MGSRDLPIVLSYNIKLSRIAMEEQNSIVVFKKICLKAKMCYNGCRYIRTPRTHTNFL